MRKIYSLATVKKAQNLLDSDAWHGDHGFKGEQLKVWNAMKMVNLAVLRRIVKHKPFFNYSDPDCPAGAVSPHIFVDPKVARKAAKHLHQAHPECVWGAVKKNPDWSGGTRAGRAWASACSILIARAEDDPDRAEYLETAIEDIADEVRSAENRLKWAIRNYEKEYGKE